MSVRIFHPSVAPFVQQVARSIHEAGQLERFMTTFRDRPDSWLQRGVCALGRLAGRDLAPQFRRRAITEIPIELVHSRPWGELLRVATANVDRDGRLTDYVWERTEGAFDLHVARSLHPGLTGIYCFEYSSLATITRARALGLRVAYDAPAPEPTFVQSILDREMAQFPELITPWHRWTAEREDRRIARRHAEFRGAHVVLACSEFTRRSFAPAGLDDSKISIVPLGSPPPVPLDEAARGGSADDAPPTFLWAGTFGIRKGAHYVLEAWRRGGFGRHARLRVFGAIALPERVMQPLPEGIELGGSIPRNVLMEHYRTSDALLFPTLCDGFGMVATEAWSRGLPVITTDCAGAADLMRGRANGRIIRAGSAEALMEAIDWCLTHRRELRAMRAEAHATAAGWQWPDYRRRLATVLAEARLFSPSR